MRSLGCGVGCRGWGEGNLLAISLGKEHSEVVIISDKVGIDKLKL